jgi:hypothetical protein
MILSQVLAKDKYFEYFGSERFESDEKVGINH